MGEIVNGAESQRSACTLIEDEAGSDAKARASGVYLTNLLAIAVAGAAGALLRYGLSGGVHRVLGEEFPYGTLLVNILGSLLIGYGFVYFFERSAASEAWRLAVLVGLLGSFTTFSTFSLETLNLLSDGAYVKAAANIVFSVTLCLAATWFGIVTARSILEAA